MQNIVTIYRFNTPFLDIHQERRLLIDVKDKIKIFLKDQNMEIREEKNETNNYQVITYFFQDVLKIEFQYMKVFQKNYFIPIFTMNISLANIFLNSNTALQKTTLFLTSLFENFDGLKEKEYLIEIDKNIFYKKGFLSSKIYPSHDFQDLGESQREFERFGEKLLADFLGKYRDSHFVLNTDTSNEYYKIYRVLSYKIYLVYIMYKSIIGSQKILNELGEVHNSHLELSQQRLLFIKNINIHSFKEYYAKLAIFLKLFE